LPAIVLNIYNTGYNIVKVAALNMNFNLSDEWPMFLTGTSNYDEFDIIWFDNGIG